LMHRFNYSHNLESFSPLILCLAVFSMDVLAKLSISRLHSPSISFWALDYPLKHFFADSNLETRAAISRSALKAFILWRPIDSFWVANAPASQWALELQETHLDQLDQTTHNQLPYISDIPCLPEVLTVFHSNQRNLLNG
jgi:hypothetical protein